MMPITFLTNEDYANLEEIHGNLEDLQTNDKSSLVAAINEAVNDSIIDVLELPTENINENALYRLLTATFIQTGCRLNVYTCYCVSTLPSAGIPATDATMSSIIAYYNISDNICYCYIDEMLSAAFSIPTGWYDFAILVSGLGEGVVYGGVVTSYDDMTDAAAIYVLIGSTIYSHKDGIWTNHEGVGCGNAEVFNSPFNIASGNGSHAEGSNTTASGRYSHAEGDGAKASGWSSHAEGSSTTASGWSSHAEGSITTASGSYSHAEGSSTTASGSYSHAEGSSTTASGSYSHAEGDSTEASGDYAHAEGSSTTASTIASHAEGNLTTASGGSSHAEGYRTTASGSYSHAEGCETTASGESSHAEGESTDASGKYSHAEGYRTTASGDYSHAQGKCNVEDTNNKYAHIVGNGELGAPSNAHTLDWDGNAWFQGDVYVGSTSGTDKDGGSLKLATETYVNDAVSNIDIPDEIYKQNEAPTNAKEGALWLDMDAKGATSGGSGGSGGVSSWNDLTDKPFGENDNAVILPETQFAYGGVLEGFDMFIISGHIEFVEGKTYTVNWNGVDYETVCFMALFNGLNTPTLGNPAAVGGENNNLPFIVGSFNGLIGAISLDGSTAVTVGIIGYAVERLQSQYAPRMRHDIIVKESDLTGTTGYDWGISYDTTELVDAIIEGHPIYVQIQGTGGYAGRYLVTEIHPFIQGDTVEQAVRTASQAVGKDKVPLWIVFMMSTSTSDTTRWGRVQINMTD